jgi:hypothetical protein
MVGLIVSSNIGSDALYVGREIALNSWVLVIQDGTFSASEITWTQNTVNAV